MSIKSWAALAAISALALSAKAQSYNWMLEVPGISSGSGQLTLSNGLVTELTGEFLGMGVMLTASVFPTDNRLPLDVNGLFMTSAAVGLINIYQDGGNQYYLNADSGDSFPASFTYTAVPEPHEYAMVAGAGMVGFGLWRRRAQRAAKA